MFRLDLFVLSFALLATCLTGGLDAGHMEIIDSEDVDISHIAAVVCQDKMGFYKKISSHLTTVDKQISRFSTIDKLVSYLKKQDDLCEGSYLESLVELQDVIATGNANLCGQHNIQAIEDYHRRYITRVSKHQKSKEAIPKIVKLFFMHYATLISSKCEQNAHQLLPDALDLLNKEQMNIDESLTSFANAIGIEDVKPQYDDVYLLWSLVENLPLEKSEKFARNFQTGDEKVFIEMKDPDNIVRLQGICSRRLRPLYINTILPVVKLVDLGYYPKSDLLIKKISSDPMAKRLYLSAQFCEALLPVVVVRNENLEGKRMNLLPIEEAKKISDRLVAEVEMQKVLKSDENIFAGVDKLESLYSEDVKVETTSIKKRVKSRGKVCKGAIKKLVQAYRAKMADKKMYITTKDGVGMEGLEDAVNDVADGKVDIDVGDNDADDPADGLVRVTRKVSLGFVILFICSLPFMVVFGIALVIFLAIVDSPARWIFKWSFIPVSITEGGLTYVSHWTTEEGQKRDKLKHLAKLDEERRKKELEEDAAKKD